MNFLYTMGLGEVHYHGPWEIWRVPGGWLWVRSSDSWGATSQPLTTFVPFDNEFMGKE